MEYPRMKDQRMPFDSQRMIHGGLPAIAQG
jgi:uncharacterized protein YbaA (DUF1428 family)